MTALLLALTLVSQTGRDSIYGLVHNAITGSPVAGVRVETGSEAPATWSTASGSYSIPHPTSGRQSVTFTAAGYDSFTVNVVVSPGSSLHLDVDLLPIPQ